MKSAIKGVVAAAAGADRWQGTTPKGHAHSYFSEFHGSNQPRDQGPGAAFPAAGWRGYRRSSHLLLCPAPAAARSTNTPQVTRLETRDHHRQRGAFGKIGSTPRYPCTAQTGPAARKPCHASGAALQALHRPGDPHSYAPKPEPSCKPRPPLMASQGGGRRCGLEAHRGMKHTSASLE